MAVPELKSRYDIAKDILTPFGVQVTEVDAKDKSIIFREDLDILHALKLPTYSYSDIITRIIREIENRGVFSL